MGANAPYVNTAGQVVPTYGAQPSQYGGNTGYTGQPASQQSNTGYANQPPQYPAYAPAPQQSNPISGFDQLSLNSTGSGSGYGNPTPSMGNAPAYPGYQNPINQGNMYNQSGSWNQGQQTNVMPQSSSGNYQQQGYNPQTQPQQGYHAPAYNQQGGTPPSGGSYY